MSSPSLQHLITVFRIAPRDLQVLRSEGPALDLALSDVLDKVQQGGEAGPMLTAAVSKPMVKELRATYWASHFCRTVG